MKTPWLRDTQTELRVGREPSRPAFDEETRAFLQRRLRLLTGTLAIVTSVLLALFIVANATNPENDHLAGVLFHTLFEFPNALVTGLVIVSGGLWALLSSRHLSSPSLAAADVLLLQALIVPCLALYAALHTFSFSGFPVVVPFLCLFILTRAVIVPSTARRTILISITAPLGVLAIQLYYGQSFAFPGQPYERSHFIDMVIQNQVLLVGSIAVAAIASKVNLSLRRRTYDAQRLGQYEIEGQIGAGGMGEVFLAKHALLKRPTAVKLLRPEIAGESTLRRFEQEVRQTSRLSHPNTVSIFDYGHTAEGVFYYAMEYLVGANLREIVELDGPMPAARVVHVLSHACAALHEAHAKGIVHRDIKPANIMLCEQGGEMDVVKILDFGLVKDVAGPSVALSGLPDQRGKEGEPDRRGKEGEPDRRDQKGRPAVVGTPETMAPEALDDARVGPMADLYSLSAVGYYLLAGKPVFEASTVAELLHSHQSAAPPRLSGPGSSVPADLEAVILRGLSKAPGDRPASALEMREALLACDVAGDWTPADAAAWWQGFDMRADRSPAQRAQTEATDSSETSWRTRI
jgi:serine/threonine-protein kinase